MASPVDNDIEAIWRLHHLEFEFISANSRYSCGALQAKIAEILHVVGARRNVAVHAECYRGEVVKHARVRIALATPVAATDENVRSATTFDTRAQLLAKLHKAELPTAADLERFPAQWRTVSFSRQRRLRLEAGDCELLHQIREQILPKLAVQITRAGPPCSVSASRLAPSLEVAALLPVARRSDAACCANQLSGPGEIMPSASTE